jgi:hypothetical protein
MLTGGGTVFAQKGKGGGPKAPQAQAAPKAPGGTKVHTGGGPKAQASGPKTHTAGPKAHVSGPRATTAKGTTKRTTTTTTASTTGSGKSKGTSTTTTTTTTATGTTTGGTATGGSTTVVLSPAQQKLQRNTNLASKLQGRLPAGTDVVQAAAGFRNLGQFVAAVNVSNNLDIPFTQLKTSMVTDGLSLGQSIQKLRPGSDYTTQVQRAETDATTFVQQYDSTATSATPTTSTSTTTTTTTTSKTSTKTKSKDKPKSKSPKSSGSGR